MLVVAHAGDAGSRMNWLVDAGLAAENSNRLKFRTSCPVEGNPARQEPCFGEFVLLYFGFPSVFCTWVTIFHPCALNSVVAAVGDPSSNSFREFYV